MGKIGKVVYYSAVILLVAVFFIMILFGDESKGTGMGLILSYILSGICGVAAVVSSVLYIMHDAANAKKMVLGMGALVLISIIFYVMSPGYLGPDYAKFGIETADMSKRIDMGLYVSIFLTLAAIVAITVSEAISLIKH
jgi:hypothetical protein